MKTFFKAFFILFIVSVQAQIGINTTTPEAQLDIKASNLAAPSNTDGLLIPRVNAFPATNPTAAQQGMMVYLMVTSGSNTPGFYFWDNISTSWIGILSDGKGDKDWYKVGSTSSPTAITDDVYRSGKVGIGTATPNSKLHVFNTSTGMTPNADALFSVESNGAAYMNLLSNTETGLLFGEDGDATRGGIVYNSDFMLFRNGGNQNRVVIGPTGNMSIGGIVPNYPLSFTTALGDKVSLWGSGAAHYGFGIQANLFQIHSASNLDDIAFGHGNSASFTETMRIKGNGNVGIGTSNPTVPLHFASALGDKVSLWGTGANHYGFGMQSNLMQIHSDFNFSDIAFGYGSSSGFTENVRFTGDGFVGIGNSNPTVPLHFPSTLGDKIALWGSGLGYYGFSVQTLALQIHTTNGNGDVVFGHGATTSLTETMRIKGTGNVGIGTSTPSSKLHIFNGSSTITPNGSSLLTVEGSGTNVYTNILSTQETGILFGASGSSANGGIIYNPGALPNSMLFRTGGNVNRMVIGATGNVALGNFTPDFPLQFPNSVGDKICLFGNTSNNYGIGVQGSLLQIHSASSVDDIAFGHGSSATLTETMRIKGTGEVGIGTSTPTAELEVNGFTKMGSTAPAVKMIKLTGTTATTQGTQTAIAHGLTSSKILSVNVLVDYAAGSSVPPSYNGSAGYEYDYFINATSITVWPKSGNSINILSKPIRILVTYEE